MQTPLQMRFILNENLLSHARAILSNRHRLYWILGGAGAGKSTVCRILSERFGIPIYDMDAHIYGAYHSRFTPDRHPNNHAWTSAENGLEWLLSMSWDEFNSFNQAALPEYLDLLTEDIQSEAPQSPLLIDGGIWHPGLLAQVLPANQIICLSMPPHSSEHIWEENKERRGMKELVQQLSKPIDPWRTFLEFDRKITETILSECSDSNIAVCTRSEHESPTKFSSRVAQVLRME